MDSGNSPLSTRPTKCYECGCNCSTINRSLSGKYIRYTKRKLVELEEDSPFTSNGIVMPQNANVEIENDFKALLETVSNQQQTIQDLSSELEEERNASASATDEAMSMIRRLQKEKAKIEMDARQFKRFADEKMAHDQEEMLGLDDLLDEREHIIESLTLELQAYKQKLMSIGQNTSMTEDLGRELELPGYKTYPRIEYNTNELVYPYGGDEVVIERYTSEETPLFPDALKDLEFQINELEKTPKTIDGGEYIGTNNVFEKVIVSQSPRRPDHNRKLSTDSSNSHFGIDKDIGHNYATGSHLDVNSNLRKRDYESEFGDDMNNRVYTVNSVHQGDLANAVKYNKASIAVGGDDYVTTPVKSLNPSQVRDLEIQNICARLRALEDDRETMRRAVILAETDKAQKLCKEKCPSNAMTVKKQLQAKSLWFIAIFKWVISIIFWRRKAPECKYKFGLSAYTAGLLMLLNYSSSLSPWRFVSSVRLRKR